MAIKLEWNMLEEPPENTGFHVYKSTSFFGYNDLPSPSITLANSVLEYTDSDVVYGETYYYAIGVIPLDSSSNVWISTMKFVSLIASLDFGYPLDSQYIGVLV